MKELLKVLAQGLVDKPEAVVVTEDEINEEGVIVFHLSVDAEEKGRVIGKQGRIAKSIRTIMRAAANKQGKKISVEID